jgi:hypothetical protein
MLVCYEVEIKGLERAFKGISNDLCDKIVLYSRENIATLKYYNHKYPIANTGKLAQMIKKNPEIKPIENGCEQEVIYGAKYSGAVEFGSKPHYVPYKVIEEWAKRKFRIRKKEKLREATIKIKKSIEKKGVLPQSYILIAIAKMIIYAKDKYHE